MLFVSVEFLLFFIVLYLVYWAVSDKWRFYLLIVASLVFYGSWNPIFTLHLLAVIVINYSVMELYRKTNFKWLFFSLQFINVINIAVYKYYYLIADSIGTIFGIDAWLEDNLRYSMRAEGIEIFLPLAISFYTFQIMSYGIDIYRKTYEKKHSFFEVLLFISFFPQLIAGPIMRANDLLPQISRLRAGDGPRPDPDKMVRGIWLILAGIIKKVVIADTLLVMAAPVFYSNTPVLEYHPWAIWQAIIALVLMLYADFSAYSDLARGFGYLIGFDVPINFRAPFFMKSFSDFWRRWHLTFSFWIRDYIYFPLGGSHKGRLRNYQNLILTFLIAGLWHGASWNFVIWGTLMGVILSLESWSFGWLPEWPKAWWQKTIRLSVTWIVFLPINILFFSSNWQWTLDAITRMFWVPDYFNSALKQAGSLETLLGSLISVILFHIYETKPDLFHRFRKYDKVLLPVSTIVVVLLLVEFAGKGQDFFYFQF